MRQVKKHESFQSKNVWVENDFLEKYDLDNISVIQLLFLTGYLTVKEKSINPIRYRLGFPNQEVRNSILMLPFKAYER
jgi:hypothetical protein